QHGAALSRRPAPGRRSPTPRRWPDESFGKRGRHGLTSQLVKVEVLAPDAEVEVEEHDAEIDHWQDQRPSPGGYREDDRPSHRRRDERDRETYRKPECAQRPRYHGLEQVYEQQDPEQAPPAALRQRPASPQCLEGADALGEESRHPDDPADPDP